MCLTAVLLIVSRASAIAELEFAANCTARGGLHFEHICYLVSTSAYTDMELAETTECHAMDDVGVDGHAAWVRE